MLGYIIETHGAAPVVVRIYGGFSTLPEAVECYIARRREAVTNWMADLRFWTVRQHQTGDISNVRRINSLMSRIGKARARIRQAKKLLENTQ